MAHAEVHDAIRGVGAGQEWRCVCDEQHGRTADTPQSQDRRDDRVPDPDRLRLEEDRARSDHEPLDAVDGQHAQCEDPESRAVGLVWACYSQAVDFRGLYTAILYGHPTINRRAR